MVKQNIRNSFITGDAEFVAKRGALTKFLYGIISTFGFRAIIDIKNGAITPTRLCTGDLKDCYKKYIDHALPRRCNPDLDVVVVDYVGLTTEDAVAIEDSIRKRFDFEHIIFQKASSVMSLNCGMGAMGISYIIKGERGSGCICLNGAAARRVQVGDVVIIISYALMDFEEAKQFKPAIVFPKEGNNI